MSPVQGNLALIHPRRVAVHSNTAMSGRPAVKRITWEALHRACSVNMLAGFILFTSVELADHPSLGGVVCILQNHAPLKLFSLPSTRNGVQVRCNS